MIARVLVDTNIIIYAYDLSEPEKQQKALAILDQLAANGAGAVSTQVLAEFFVNVTSKIPQPLSLDQAYGQLEQFLRAWTVLEVSGLVVLTAARGVKEHQFSFWDAQIWAVAHLNQVPIVLSEDFASGTTVEGVHFANPLAPRFNLSGWLA